MKATKNRKPTNFEIWLSETAFVIAIARAMSIFRNTWRQYKAEKRAVKAANKAIRRHNRAARRNRANGTNP